MRLSLSEIARLIGAHYTPPLDPLITGVASLEEAKEGDITFLADKKNLRQAMDVKASAMVVPYDLEGIKIPHIRSRNPFYSFTKIMRLFSPAPEESLKRGVDGRSVVGEGVVIGKDAYIGPYSVIGNRAVIGERAVIYPHVFIGDESVIGDGCVIYPHVSIYHMVEIGPRAIIHSGAVIGSDGFGYLEIDGRRHKIPQIGKVVIEEDVEIGANTTIDRATLGKTWIKSGTKIDNLVQIGHNTLIGSNTAIAGMVGISGSVKVGSNVTLAGQVGVSDHVEIGDGVVAGGRSGISKDVPAGAVIFGSPAAPLNEEKRRIASVRMLPELFRTVEGLRKKVKEIEDRLGVNGG
jgi:UDP-3-O-[3-hydroxymyristoyl] glucosamine N-acyltransferase